MMGSLQSLQLSSGSSSNSMNAPEAWADSLVGKDWEIYWEDTTSSSLKDDDTFAGDGADVPAVSHSKHDDAPPLDRSEQPLDASKQDPSAKVDNDNNNDNDENSSDDDDDEGFSPDWYDATVVAYDRQTRMFQVQFVGDETVYDMELQPDIVRPCVRAWIRRTKALLLMESSSSSSFHEVMEQCCDTSTLQDRPHLEHLRGATIGGCLGEVVSHGDDDDDDDELPLGVLHVRKEVADIQRLLYSVQAQLYLRTKLPEIVEQHGGGGSSNGGEIPTSESYLNHLVHCLEQVEQLCRWHHKCWLLQESVVHGNEHSSVEDVTGEPSTGELVGVDFIRTDCMSRGGSMILGAYKMDVSPVGAKKRPAVVSSDPSRRKKRRKGYKESGFLLSSREKADNDGEDGDVEAFSNVVLEGRTLTRKAVLRFVDRVEQKHKAWYLLPFAKMLLRMCMNIQEPVLKWKKEAEAYLCVQGDTDSNDDESTSEDERDSDEAVDHVDSDNRDESEGDEDEDSVDEVTFFSYKEIQEFITLATHDSILKRVDLRTWTSKLKEKLAGIDVFEKEAWNCISHLVEEVGGSSKSSDSLLSKLRKLRHDAVEANPHVSNIDPLGRDGSRMNREVIDNAIAVREWLLDLDHAELVRERLTFVQDVVSRAHRLPHVPQPPQDFGNSDISSDLSETMSRVQLLSSKLYSHVHVSSKYERMITETHNGVRDPEGLMTLPGVAEALDVLGAIPVISVGEERLRVRHSILTWADRVQKLRSSREMVAYPYEIIQELHEELESIRQAKCSSRMQLVGRLVQSDAVDADIRGFAASDIALLCEAEATWLERLYQISASWKEKADSIIMALRIHGNAVAGPAIQSSKQAAMVDIKRVHDLLSELDSLEVTFQAECSVLKLVQAQAFKWSADVDNIVASDSEHLESLVAARDNRPIGLVMDPARHVVDTWIDVLDWHKRVIGGMATLSASFAQAPAGTNSNVAASYLHPLLVEGLEIVDLYRQKRHVAEEAILALDLSKAVTTKLLETCRVARPISSLKLESTTSGSLLLSRMVDTFYDRNKGSPLYFLLFLLWRLRVLDVIHRKMSPATDGNTHPSLGEADELKSACPKVAEEGPNVTSGTLSSLLAIFAWEVSRFDNFVSDAKNAESVARGLLSATKGIARDSFSNAQAVRDHLARLKELQADMKARAQPGGGLRLNLALERSVDQTAKDVAWLVRTLPYRTLHCDDVENDAPVPWDVLVSLYERIPPSVDEWVGSDLARVSVRVKELHEAANAWQEEVTMQMSLSFRGAKRRTAGGTTSMEEDENSSLDPRRLAQLAKHPVLARVSMPRADAVRSVLHNSSEFEMLLGDLLDKDFVDLCADKAPLPKSRSLVGKNGEFILYRLSGSNLFSALQNDINRLKQVAADVLADTPGKSAFEWIVRAVSWIKELQGSVSSIPPYEKAGGKYVIRFSDAKRLHSSGKPLFLEISDEVRKTLAGHRISLSTNQQTKRLTVVIGKGGAHHSVGGTVIRWCPLLLDCLQTDLTKYLRWDQDVTHTANSFKLDAATIMQSGGKDLDEIFSVYRFREQVSALLGQALDEMVVIPPNTTLDGLKSMIQSIDRWAKQHLQRLPGSLNLESLHKRYFEDSTTVVDNRFELLDSLLRRRQLEESDSQETRKIIQNTPVGTSYRDKARSVLEKVLRKGMQMMAVEDAGVQRSEISHFCALKAWEVENAVYEAYQRGAGIAASETYINKVRSLKHNLDDLKNPTFCPRVLVGDISAERLVRMSSEEMASKELRQSRAKAEEEAKRNIIINPGASKKGQVAGSVKSPVGAALKTTSLFDPSPLGQGKPKLNLKHLLTSPGSTAISAPPLGLFSEADGAPFTDEAPLSADLSATPPPLDLSKLMARRKRPSPPPPPPLVPAKAQPVAAPPVVEPAQLKGSSGGTLFSITISKTFKFKASFQQDTSQASLDGFLPETLSEKGRLKIEEFSKFLSDKLRSGRWKAVALQLLPAPGLSTTEHKRFHKEYETKQRIAMFGVGKDSKLFLVTPKFHSAAAELVKLGNKKSTYGIVLMRARQFS